MTYYNIAQPRDTHNDPIAAGLGTPNLIESKVVTSASFGTSVEAVDYIGDNEGRNYRHMAVYNLTGDAAIVIGFSDSATVCSTSSIKVPSGYSIVFDTILFGPNNNITHIHFKRSGGTTATVDVVYW